ncbi:MAG: carbonic anhydrase [Fuerstiella sp.]
MPNFRESNRMPRRAFHCVALGGVALGGVALGGVALGAMAAGIGPAALSTVVGCDELAAGQQDAGGDELQRLIAGNKRFVAGSLKHPHLGNDWRKRLSRGQKPFATILGCSDSRVPPELLFDQGFGDLFVIRIAGNVVDTDVTGSVEYGVDHLGTRLVVVMGHDGCGAVTAALGANEDVAKEPKAIRSLVGKIQPAVATVKKEQDFAVRLKQSVEANVRASVQQLIKVPDLQRAIAAKKTKIIGCVYDIDSGQVRTLDV